MRKFSNQCIQTKYSLLYLPTTSCCVDSVPTCCAMTVHISVHCCASVCICGCGVCSCHVCGCVRDGGGMYRVCTGMCLRIPEVYIIIIQNLSTEG